MDNFECSLLKDIVQRLISEELLIGKLFIAGGIVPYLYSSMDSGRQHNDIDIVVELDNMPLVRDYLKLKGYYDSAIDSQAFPFNKECLDYGLEVYIDDVPVNFAPFFVQGDAIIQRNFFAEELTGQDALVTVTMDNMAIQDYVITSLQPSGMLLGSYTLEMVKCAKENSNRKKDIQDNHVIDSIGINQLRYDRIKPVVETMKMAIITET